LIETFGIENQGERFVGNLEHHEMVLAALDGTVAITKSSRFAPTV